jgi:hypothetical protein
MTTLYITIIVNINTITIIVDITTITIFVNTTITIIVNITTITFAIITFTTIVDVTTGIISSIRSNSGSNSAPLGAFPSRRFEARVEGGFASLGDRNSTYVLPLANRKRNWITMWIVEIMVLKMPQISLNQSHHTKAVPA